MNERIIPTHSDHDIRNKIELPNKVTLEGGQVVTGMIVHNADMNSVTVQDRDPKNLLVNNIPGNGHVMVRWIVKGGNKFTVNVDSKKGGLASASTN